VRTDICWRWFFILFVGGMCGFSIFWNGVTTVEEDRPDIRLAFTVARKQWFELKMPYLLIVAMAAWLDVKDFWNVLRWVIGIGSWSPWFQPEFEFVGATNKLHVHNWPRGEEIALDGVKELILITREHCVFIAATYVFGALPWASLSLAMGYQYARELGHLFGTSKRTARV
jgi:hypothetical protein